MDTGSPLASHGSHCCILRGDKTSRAVTGAGSAGMLHSGWQGTSVAGGRRGWQGPCRQGEALDLGISRERSPTTEGKLGAKGTLLLTLSELFFSPWHVSVKNSLGF